MSMHACRIRVLVQEGSIDTVGIHRDRVLCFDYATERILTTRRAYRWIYVDASLEGGNAEYHYKGDRE